MCKKLFFLISFVLVLGLCSNALADDLNPPDWAGAEDSTYAIWNFDEGAYEDLFLPEVYIGDEENHVDAGSLWGEEGPGTEVLAAFYDYGGEIGWADEYEGRQGVAEEVWEMIGILNNYPRDEDRFKRIRVQVTYIGAEEVEELWEFSPEMETADDGDWNWWTTDDAWIPWMEEEYETEGVWEITELEDGWFHAWSEVDTQYMTGNEDFPLNPGAEVFFIHMAGAMIDQIIIDTICYSGDEPPAGPEREKRRGATNGRPQGDRVDPDELVLVWDKDPNALAASEHVWFSDIENDVTDRNDVSDASKGVQDANSYPMAGYLDVNLGTTYFWAIDETLDFDPCYAPGSVWQFTVIDVYAENPSPEDDANYVSPCPELKWDPGYDVVTHKLYFSDVFADVNDRNSVCLLTPPDPCYDAGPLLEDTEYFWCVDEVNAGDVNAFGPVWSFTTGPDPDTDAPDFRGETDSFQVNWLFTNDWGDEMPIWDSCSIIPANPNFDPCCVDEPNSYEASYTPFEGSSRTGIAEMNEPPDSEGSLRLKHPDYATPGQYVDIRVSVIWSGEEPGIVIERLSGWGDGPLQYGDPGYSPRNAGLWLDDFYDAGGEKNSEEPELLYEIELCDGWMYSVYEVTFEAVAEDANNIHVLIESGGDFRMDSVVVDAHWWTSLFAAGPTPLDETEDVAIGTCLKWYAGLYADEHDIYFGKSWEEVNEMTDPCWTTLLGTETYCPELDIATEYFWRITEVNDACEGSPWIGPIWSFTTAEYMVIDDFDDYTGTSSGDNQLVIMSIGGPGTWEDYHTLDGGGGQGCQVKLAGFPSTTTGPSTSPPHSMLCKYFLDLVGPYEARRTYADDGLLDGSEPFKALVLWFYGVATIGRTPAGEIYVTLKDSAAADGDEATVHYGDASCVYEGAGDVCDLVAKEYLKWAIPLSAFEADNVDIDLDQIKSIAIGVSGGGGRGNIYFDDIRLYGRACHPEYSWHFGDFTGPDGVPDCVVGYYDIGAMQDAWLETDSSVVVAAPCDVNLIVEYTFNDNTLTDTAGDNDGIDINTVSLHDGILTLGAAAPAVADWVEVPIDANIFNGPFTIVMEVKMEEVSGFGNVLFGVCPPTPNDVCETSTSYLSYDYAMTLFHCVVSEFGTDAIVRDHSYIGTGGVIEESGAADGGWHTVVTISDGNSEQVTYLITAGADMMYGENLDFQVEGPNLGVPERHKVMIGHSYHPAYSDVLHDDFMGATSMVGDVNSVQIYNYTMPYEQVLYLAGRTPGEEVHIPLGYVNLYEKTPEPLPPDEIVNFRDFALLSDNWLMDAYWPPKQD